VRRSINAGEVDPSAHRIKGPRQLARTGGQCAHRGAIGFCSGRIVGKQDVIWSVKACCIRVSGNQIIGKLPASTLSLGKLTENETSRA